MEECLASGDQRKNQRALQRSILQENKKRYTTNTSSKSAYEPQFNHNMWKDRGHSSQSSCSGELYYLSRNVPHPRMVCHMPGLNNTPVCVVRNSFSREYPPAHNRIILKEEAEQKHKLNGNTTSNTFANHRLPKLKGVVGRELGTSQSMTQRRADVLERTQNNPTSSEKLLKKQFQASAQPASRQGIHVKPLTPLSSTSISSRNSSCIQENVNSDLSFLGHEIKVLEKLSKILQTDSLSEIQKWFARANKKEKDFVYNMIYAERTDKGKLNSEEDTAENMNSLDLLKPLSPLQRGPEREDYQSRSSAKESVASQSIKQKRTSLPLSAWKQRSSASRHTVSREELQSRKSCGNKRPSCLHTLPEVPQPPPNNRYPLSCYLEPLKHLPVAFTYRNI